MSTGGRDLCWPWFVPGSVADVRPGDTVRFADLTGVSFREADLTGVRFFGCAVNGASFSGSVVGASFIGCLASRHGEPMRSDSPSRGPIVIRSHLEGVEGFEPAAQWPDDVAELAWRALQGDNFIRYKAVEALGARAFTAVAPLMAMSLRDEEWEVRGAAVRALSRLRGRQFPDGDEALVRALITALGDRSEATVQKHLNRYWWNKKIDVVISYEAPPDPE